MIFFASVQLDQTVHCVPGGFTDYEGWFVMGEDAQDAARLIEQYLADHLVGIRRLSFTAALNQDLSGYTFPDSVIGSPQYFERRARKLAAAA